MKRINYLDVWYGTLFVGMLVFLHHGLINI